MKNKKYLWIVLVIIIIILLLYFFTGKKVEYSEMNNSRPHLGNPESSVVIHEYSDFQCPACQSSQIVVEAIMNEYSDQIKLEFYNLPLTSIHKYAYKAAEAAACANDQNKFWEYHDMLYSHQEDLTMSDLESYAETIGLDVELWNDCLTTRTKKYVIEKDLSEALNLGLNSTPTFFLNGQRVESWGDLPSLVEALVKPVTALDNDQVVATSTAEE